MKKILLSILILSVLSCKKDDEECTCEAEYKISLDSEGSFFVPNMPIDCDTNIPFNPPQEGAIFLGCRD